MIHNNTANRSQITSLPQFDDKYSINRNLTKNEADDLRKALKSSQKILVESISPLCSKLINF